MSAAYSRVATNVVANFAGLAWAATIGFALVPVYLHLLGVESYGLIAFYLVFQSVLGVLDFGISPTLNRELARRSGREGDQTRDLLRTVELVYASLGAVIAATVFFLAPTIAAIWIHPQNLTSGSVEVAVRWIAILIGLQWPISMYAGGLMGLQQQVTLSVISAIAATLRGVGAVSAMLLIAPDINVYLAWQVVASLVQLVVIRTALWRSLGKGKRPRLALGLLRSPARFAAGLTAITVLGVILTQLDKLVVSGLLDLREFGYYALGATVAAGEYVVITPIFSAYFPRLSELVAAGDQVELRNVYHNASQFMTVVLAPVALTVALFAPDIISVWTNNPEAVARAAPVAALLALGTMLNGFMNLPYALQLSYGWTRISIRINLFLLAVTLPALVVLTRAFGAVGAAAAWPLMNGLYVAIGARATHQVLLRGEGRIWLTRDVILPTASTAVFLLTVRALVSEEPGRVETAARLVVTLIGALAVATLASPMARSVVMDRLRHTRVSE